MALETVLYSQDPFSYNTIKDYYSLLGISNDHLLLSLQQQLEIDLDQDHKPSLDSIIINNNIMEIGHGNNLEYDMSLLDHSSFSSPAAAAEGEESQSTAAEAGRRRKRRRARSSKNKEELETQRMTHIAVERNRRRQMNDYLAVLRSLMPPSCVQRGDQASIIGGAINYVKELEHMLQSLESQKQKDENLEENKASVALAEFLAFPQYTRHSAGNNNNNDNNESSNKVSENKITFQNNCESDNAMADIEVTVVDSHANLKILAQKQPKLLLRLVAGLQAQRLGILHLNVTTAEEMHLYSLSLKIEEGCQLNTVDEIATAVNQMLRRIHEETAFTRIL